jgi:hypothetical protein
MPLNDRWTRIIVGPAVGERLHREEPDALDPVVKGARTSEAGRDPWRPLVGAVLPLQDGRAATQDRSPAA